MELPGDRCGIKRRFARFSIVPFFRVSVDQNQKTPSHEGQRQGTESDAHAERSSGPTPVCFANVSGRREIDENRNAPVRAQLHMGIVPYTSSSRVHRTITVRPRSTINAHNGRRHGQHRRTRQHGM